MPPISKPEVRFKEASGEQFLDNGKIRCHGLAKSRMRQWREAYNDYDTPSEELWPECQCRNAAEEGQYVCRFHGGATPRTISPPRTMLDVLPLDMAEKYKALMDNPDYISRKDDINVLRARTMVLLDQLKGEIEGEEAWGSVAEALVAIKHGDLVNAVDYLETALSSVNNQRAIWKEFYQVEKLLGEMTTIQMKTAKELQSMATVEQVNALVSTLIHLINSGAQHYIADPMQRSDFTRTIVYEMQKLMGTTPVEMLHANNSD